MLCQYVYVCKNVLQLRHLISDGPMHVDYFHAWDLDKNGKLTLEEV